jgi:hypothetical protein
VIDGGGSWTVIENGLVAVREKTSLTRTVNVQVPTNVGVPLMTPAEESPSPVGRAPKARDQEYGTPPPVAVSVAEYDTPKVPPGKDGVVIESVCARSSGPHVNANISTTSERKCAFSRVACTHLFETFIGSSGRTKCVVFRLQHAANSNQ